MPGHAASRLVQLDRNLQVTGVVVSCAILVGGLLIVQRSLATERSAIDAEIADARQVLHEEDAIRAEHAQLKARLTALQKRAGRLLNRIPDSPREAEFLAQLSELASESHLTIHSYRPQSPVASDRCQSLDIEVAAAGQFDSLCHFLEGLGSLPRLCRLYRLDVESAGGGDGGYPVTMTLRIFFAPEPSAVSDTAAEAPAA